MVSINKGLCSNVALVKVMRSKSTRQRSLVPAVFGLLTCWRLLSRSQWPSQNITLSPCPIPLYKVANVLISRVLSLAVINEFSRVGVDCSTVSIALFVILARNRLLLSVVVLRLGRSSSCKLTSMRSSRNRGDARTKVATKFCQFGNRKKGRNLSGWWSASFSATNTGLRLCSCMAIS